MAFSVLAEAGVSDTLYQDIHSLEVFRPEEPEGHYELKLDNTYEWVVASILQRLQCSRKLVYGRYTKFTVRLLILISKYLTGWANS